MNRNIIQMALLSQLRRGKRPSKIKRAIYFIPVHLMGILKDNKK